MKRCRYCSWMYDESQGRDKVAKDQGFCSLSCVMAWEYEKDQAKDRARWL